MVWPLIMTAAILVSLMPNAFCKEGTSLPTPCSTADGDPIQMQALMAVKKGLGDSDKLTYWTTYDCPCYTRYDYSHQSSWKGVTCKGSQVIGLDLSDLGLEGSLVDSISMLNSLISLDLSYNKVKGPLPTYLGVMPFMKSINVAYTPMTCDTMPTWLSE